MGISQSYLDNNVTKAVLLFCYKNRVQCSDSENSLHKTLTIPIRVRVGIAQHHHNIGAGGAFLMDHGTNFDFKDGKLKITLSYEELSSIAAHSLKIMMLRNIRELSL